MSVICQNFVQNAWRKDLCSNCFKSEADHQHSERNGHRSDRLTPGRYVPQAASLYQNRGFSSNIHWRPLLPLLASESGVPRIQSLVSSRDFGSQTNTENQMTTERGMNFIRNESENGLSKKTRRCSVGFTSDEPLVIGYGGNDYDSDDSPWELGSDDGSINWDLLDLTDEDRSITRLTKNNTEFNSDNDNLKPSPLIGNRDRTFKTSTPDTTGNLKNDTILNNSLTRCKDSNKNLGEMKNNISSYYFASPNQNLTSTTMDHVRLLNQNKEMSLIANEIPSILNNIKNNIIKNSGSDVGNINDIALYKAGKVQDSKCQFNTTTTNLSSSGKYLLITKTNDSSETGSDSDYSTSKQTMAESSTDTESFHDAEETPMIPCSSFLHGKVHTTVPMAKTKSASYNDSKSFETSSESSGDMSSTLSDDSDIQKPNERTKQRIGMRNVKVSQNESKSTQPHVTITKIQPNVTPKQMAKPERNNFASETIYNDSQISELTNSRKTTEIALARKSATDSDASTVDSNFKRQTQPFKSNQTKLKKNSVSVTDHSPKTNASLSIATKIDVSPKVEDRNSPSAKDIAIPKQDFDGGQKPPEVISRSHKSRLRGRSDSETSSSTQAEDCNNINELNDQNKDKLMEYKQWLSDNNKDYNNYTPQSTRPASSTHSDATESNSSSNRSSPKSDKLNRQSKLAELALELEKVRCDADRRVALETSSPSQTDTPKSEVIKKVPSDKPKSEVIPNSNKYPSIRRGRGLLKSNQESLPDLLPETPVKTKKSRFSLKKFLKRGKDSDTLVINGSSEFNPKAWKRQQFDRARLSLEIVHPMDLTLDEDFHPSLKKSNTNRARSLSALPQLISCVSEIGDELNDYCGQRKVDHTSSLGRTRLEMPRKAGTVAERSKKYKAPRRTPSFSELQTPPSTTQSQSSDCDGTPSTSERPPKPPPPPRTKLLPPPQPPITPRSEKPVRSTQPSRPPPPKALSEANKSNDIDSNYANLGDIRLTITPKKPQRPSAVTFVKDVLDAETDPKHSQPLIQEGDDNPYEVLDVQEEEDHYTYLDELEVKNGISSNSRNRVDKTQKASIPSRELVKTNGEPTSCDSESPTTNSKISRTLKKPWMDLQASYAAIAAANYESLAELITTAISDGIESFKKSAASLKWSNFELESDQAQILESKAVYNAIYEKQQKIKVTLMVTTRKQQAAQNSRNSMRLPILASFTDYLPCCFVDVKPNQALPLEHHETKNTTKAVIYVLQRAKATTVNQFAEDSASFQTNQHIHLRNACFVLLQLIHTLKILQAEGIEEIDYDLRHILLLHTDLDKPPILVLLPEDKSYLTMADKAETTAQKMTLCQTTLKLLYNLLHIKSISEVTTCVVNGEFLAAAVANTFNVIAKVLTEEKASSLSQAKGLLEYMLWGPVDIMSSENEGNMDVMLQRWLDLQRAQMVKSLVSNLHIKISAHAGFHVYEEYQLIFLLQATVKSLKDVISKL